MIIGLSGKRKRHGKHRHIGRTGTKNLMQWGLNKTYKN